MATASAVTTRRGNDQFRGLFSDTWAVTCTMNAGSLVDAAGETDDITVPGVALGDMVIGASLGVDLVGRRHGWHIHWCRVESQSLGVARDSHRIAPRAWIGRGHCFLRFDGLWCPGLQRCWSLVDAPMEQTIYPHPCF